MKSLVVLLLATLATLTLGGCGSRDMAAVNSSTLAEKMFTGGKVSPHFTYYYYGPKSHPTALLALDRDYTIDSEFWTRIDLTDQELQQWLRDFRANTLAPGSAYRGREIVSPHSRVIGYVYSRYYWVTAWFQDPRSNVVVIPPPQPGPLQPSLNRGNENDH